MKETTLTTATVNKIFKMAERALDNYNANSTPENHARFDAYTEMIIALGLDDEYLVYLAR